MKKFFRLTPLFALLVPILYFTGCKKCYHCSNTCTMCVHTYLGPDTLYKYDSTAFMDTIYKIDSVIRIDSFTNCTDYFGTMGEYDSAIAKDAEQGYNCFPIPPNYQHDFCVTKPGEEQYINYYDKGGRAPCNPK